MSANKHHGSFDKLKRIVRASGQRGKWATIHERDQKRFDGRDGEVVNWWPATGTVQVQGKDAENLRSLLSRKLRLKVPGQHG
ncbi:hypothetical protein [Lichenihabitans psoromatis]|uniref:hypothetical protein n=1 Tax=Lichenihabitans psoromatis TaxID=2528642 RepID=UPI0010382D4B|nr:hypothetical protein [Lichenihabitans psoromatis]